MNSKIHETLDPHWDFPTPEPRARRYMRARMTDAIRSQRLPHSAPFPPATCAHCRRPIDCKEHRIGGPFTCNHCETQWRAFRRSQARIARAERTLLYLLYITATIGLGCILGQLCSGGCR